jgi:hypothetical protein
MRISRLGVIGFFMSALVLGVACSSSSSPPAFTCKTFDDTCECRTDQTGSTGVSCDETSVPTTGVPSPSTPLCCADSTWPSSGQCVCESTVCFQVPGASCSCFVYSPTTASSSNTPVAACPAGPACLTSDESTTVDCFGGTCASQQLSGTTTDITTGCSPQVAGCAPGHQQVTSCSDGSKGPSVGGGGGGNTCSPGPGTCKNGDSSTCSCATSCQHVCATCDYACLRNCSADSQCSDLTDSSGAPLVCSTCPQGVCNAGFSACDAKR